MTKNIDIIRYKIGGIDTNSGIFQPKYVGVSCFRIIKANEKPTTVDIIRLTDPIHSAWEKISCRRCNRCPPIENICIISDRLSIVITDNILTNTKSAIIPLIDARIQVRPKVCLNIFMT